MPAYFDDMGRIFITSTHRDYDRFVKIWDYIDNVVTGRDVDKHIPTLNPRDDSDENMERNRQYKERAVFLKIAGRTVNRMVGLVFVKWPVLNIDGQLDYILTNVDGAGISIYQQSQACLKSVISKGRAGLLVEYPIVDGQCTREDMNRHELFATIQRFEPQQIINWSLDKCGAKLKLGRVVLRDIIEEEYKVIEIYRELVIEDGVYVSRLWRHNGKGDDDGGGFILASESIPRDGSGNTWDEIPFIFIGAETNQSRIDEPPMIDICEGNICHYRLHADYMDSVHYVGQPMAYVNGIEDVKLFLENLTDTGWYMGSRQVTVLPPGGVLGYAAVPPNPLVKVALEDMKNDLMGMGAFYITPGSAVKTAAQAEGEQEEQHSILSLAASNVSEAYGKCLEWMYKYMNIEITDEQELDGKIVDDTPIYDLRRDFIRGGSDPQLITALWAVAMGGGMPMTDFWQMLRKGEIIDPEKTDEEIKTEIESSKPEGETDAGLASMLGPSNEPEFNNNEPY